jgi:DNA-binding NarL/FixJ family response regulator
LVSIFQALIERPMTNSEQDSTPLAVLVVDDDDENRELSEEIFATSEVRAVGASTKSQAERELIAHPGIDAISLDVSLRSAGGDKEGAELAVQIRRLRPELPIVGYSAYFDEGDLSPEERAAFTTYYHRGGSTDDIREYVNRCREEGLRYRQHRRELFEEQLSQLERAGQLSEREYSVLRSFAPAPGDEMSIEQALRSAGYRVEVILPSPPPGTRYLPRRPFVVWTRPVDGSDEFEAEVFGQPALYGLGSTAGEAVQRLVEVFWLFVSEVVETPRDELQGPALSLAHFFEHVLTDV